MIVENGKIIPKIKADGGFDDNGFPVPATEDFGEPISCNISVNKHDNLGKANGNSFTIASYVILIEAQKFSADKVKLIDAQEADLGEFAVIYAEPLQAVGAIKILV
ncbi:MAG: hypothetical protein ACRCZB_04240 [Bacteroidales bacterium]